MHRPLAILLALALARPALSQTAPAIDFSGLTFGSFNLRTDSAAKTALAGKSPNQFSIDRVYLTFRMPAGDNGSVRVTTDLYQNTSAATNGYYQGWAIRLKYAYFQYTGMKGAFGAGSSLTGRVGSLQNVIIDQTESFWPRHLQQTAVERAGFFSSADVGVAGVLTLGGKLGELYATIVNGPGYASYERDRFKDYAIRASITPFARAADGPFKSLVIAPWYYSGSLGSSFAAGGPGQVGPGDNGAINDGLSRDRYGIFAGTKSRRLALGVEYAQRMDESEAGANTAATPRVVTDSTGRLIDGFIVARPLEWVTAATQSPLAIVARIDRFTPNTSPESPNYAGTTPSYDFTLLGASYELNQRITLALDWQQTAPKGFPPPTGANVRPTPRQSTVFLHWQATF